MTKIKFQRDARPVFYVSEGYAIALIDRLLTGSNIFSVENIKADGSARKYLVCPNAYRAEIKGTGKPLDAVKMPCSAACRTCGPKRTAVLRRTGAR